MQMAYRMKGDTVKSSVPGMCHEAGSSGFLIPHDDACDKELDAGRVDDASHERVTKANEIAGELLKAGVGVGRLCDIFQTSN